jgi:DNA-binding transcriptional LysR family regulator
MNFTLRQLRAFVSVARLGSFTRAARTLDISQPALTVQIRQLEDALGVRLLDRNTRSVTLSQVGREFVPVLERILEEINTFTSDARDVTSRRRGLVTIAAIPSICSSLLPDVVAQFKSAHPGITVKMRDTLAQTVIALVKTREVDFGIASSEHDPEIEMTALFTDRMSVLFPPGHPIGQHSRITLKELSRCPLIYLDAGSSVRALVERAFESTGMRVAPAYEVTYMTTAIAMVRAGLAVTVLPAATAQEAQQTSDLLAREIHHERFRRQICLIQASGRSASPAAKEFMELVQAVCKARKLADSTSRRSSVNEPGRENQEPRDTHL